MTTKLDIKCDCGNPWKLSDSSYDLFGDLTLHCPVCNSWYTDALDTYTAEELETLETCC
jgi:hypothetical protein